MSVDVRVSVAAPPLATWRRFADFGSWPEWNPACVAAEMRGPLAAGTVVRLHLLHPRGRGFWTAPRLTAVEPGRGLCWESRGLGFRAATAVTFTPGEDGTLVHLASTSTGALGFTYRLTFPETTQGLVWSGALTGLARAFGT